MKKAIALRANYPDPMYALAKIEFREGNARAAVPLLERAVNCAPEQQAIHLLLARTYQTLGQSDKANLSSPRCAGSRPRVSAPPLEPDTPAAPARR